MLVREVDLATKDGLKLRLHLHEPSAFMPVVGARLDVHVHIALLAAVVSQGGAEERMHPHAMPPAEFGQCLHWNGHLHRAVRRNQSCVLLAVWPHLPSVRRSCCHSDLAESSKRQGRSSPAGDMG